MRSPRTVGTVPRDLIEFAAFNIEVSDLDSPEATMTTKYEYRVVRFDMAYKTMGSKLTTDFGAMEKELSTLGSEGWELVKVSEIVTGTVITIALVAFLKRTAG
jgi:hypothetical protein